MQKKVKYNPLLIVSTFIVTYMAIIICVYFFEKRLDGLNKIDNNESVDSEKSFNNDYFFDKWVSNENLSPFVFDTIFANRISFQNYINDDNSGQYSINELEKQLAKNSYKLNKSLCIWNEEDVSEAIYQYNKYNTAPYKLVKEILPKTQSPNQLIFEKIYSKIERSNHIQLIVLGYGYIYPTIQLVTLKKENFEFVDSVIFYSISRDENEIVRIKGCLNETFDTLSFKEIHSYESYSDTITYDYNISESGEIKLIE